MYNTLYALSRYLKVVYLDKVVHLDKVVYLDDALMVRIRYYIPDVYVYVT